MTGLIPRISSSAPETSSLSRDSHMDSGQDQHQTAARIHFWTAICYLFFGGDKNTQKRSCRNSSVSNKCKSCVVCQPALKSKHEIVPKNKYIKKKELMDMTSPFFPPKPVSMTLTCISIGSMFCNYSCCLVSAGLFRGSCFPGN